MYDVVVKSLRSLSHLLTNVLFIPSLKRTEMLTVFGERDDRSLLPIGPAELKSRSLCDVFIVM